MIHSPTDTDSLTASATLEFTALARLYTDADRHAPFPASFVPTPDGLFPRVERMASQINAAHSWCRLPRGN